MNGLLEIPYNKDIKFVSFDITNVCLNTPVKELLKIIKLICNKNGLIEELNQSIKYCKM
jgi:hypothetical protein